MAVARRQTRSRPLIVVLVLISLTLVAVDQAGDSSPVHPLRSVVRDGFAAIGHGARAVWPFEPSNSVEHLQAENARLQHDLDEANGRLARAADAERENKQLNELFALPTPDNTPKVIASVVDIGASNYDATIELSKGAKDGIKVGMPVMTGAGLVGRVVQTSNTRSTVLLITDKTSNVSIRYTQAGDVGLASGEGMGKLLRGKLINLDSAIEQGEITVTSGLDGSVFPPGLPVAKVKTVGSGAQDVRRNVTLEPIADLDKLDDVAVLQWQR